MGRLLVATIVAVSAIALTQTASADMPVRATAAPAVAPYNWTGFYAGLNAGVGWSDAAFGITPIDQWLGFGSASVPFLIATNRTVRANGLMIGGQAGYNYQINRFVLGIEGDFDFYNAEETFTGGRIPTTSIVGYTQTTRQTWFATVRGRLGWAASDRWMLYATGGLAVSNWAVSMSLPALPTATAIFSNNETRTGWTVGGGVETVLAPQWTFKAEYLYSDFGDVTGSSTFPTPPITPGYTHLHRVELVTQVVRVGLNYRF